MSSKSNGYKVKVLLAEEEWNSGKLLQQQFTQLQFDTTLVHDGLAAYEHSQKEDFDVLVLDLDLPNLTGIEVLRRVKQSSLAPEVIIITRRASVETAIEAMKLGAYDYLTKPVKVRELEELIRKAYEKRRLRKENVIIKKGRGEPERFLLTMSRSRRMREIVQLIHKVAKSNSTILITGESGTGKEVIAQAIHQESLRLMNAFTDISCAAITETLLESELFGHEKGSFTGAESSKPGLFEMANGGTLFLDEIGELGPALQAKLLRVLETRSFYRVGGTKQITVDVRILVATNKDLKKEVETGRFRKDLFYRLNTININVPPLRDRVEDIPLLVDQFLREFSRAHALEVSEEVMQALKRYPWPGNVRELRNVIERAVLISHNSMIDLDDLPSDIAQFEEIEMDEASLHRQLPDSLTELEKQQILSVLKKVRWHRGKAAELLQISPKTLYRKIKRYDLEKMFEAKVN